MPKLKLSLEQGGGHLVTRHSADEVGGTNYVVKRDWRREANDEVRREGDAYFYPQSPVSTSAKSANFQAVEGDNGKKFTCSGAFTVTFDTVSVGWWALFEKTDAGTVTITGIGTLAAAGDTILALMTPGGLVDLLSVALDGAPTLIFTGRRDDGKTALIVGTATTLYRYFATEEYRIYESGVYVANVIGYVTTGVWLTIGSAFTTTNAHRWEAVNAAGYIVFNNGIDLPVLYHLNEFEVQPIRELRENGIAFAGTMEELNGIVVFGDLGIIHDTYLEIVMDNVGYGGFANGQESHIDRVHYRIMWGDPKGPKRWGSAVPGSIDAGRRLLTLDYRMDSVSAGDSIRIIGAGEDGADLVTTLLFKSSSDVWVIADKASTPVASALVSLADASTLIVGRFDTLDVASPILRIKKFQDRLIVAKSTGFIVGEYTGQTDLPFVFQTVYSKEEEENCLYWKWTLTDVRGEYLLYAGATEFYRFDLVTRRPQLHPVMYLCSDLFFSGVATATQDQVFSAINGFTKEAWFVFPGSGSDKALALYVGGDVNQERAYTIGQAYSALGYVSRPSSTIVHGSEDKLFVAGLANGRLVKYGYERTGPVLWTRRGTVYSSELRDGYNDFGDAGDEKHISELLVLLASQSPNTAISVAFFGVRNPAEALAELPDSPFVFTTPTTRCMCNLHYVAHLIQNRITCNATGNVRLRLREWKYGRTGSSNFARR